MARARMLKPEFFEDEKLGTVSRDARLLYAGLWTLADDTGNVKVNATFIRSRLFPYDDDISIIDVALWVSELEQIGRLVRYEVEGEKYAAIPKFSRHQTINKPSNWRNPPPLVTTDSDATSVPLLHHDGSGSDPTHVGVTSEVKDEVEVEDKATTTRVGTEPLIDDPTSSNGGGGKDETRQTLEAQLLEEFDLAEVAGALSIWWPRFQTGDGFTSNIAYCRTIAARLKGERESRDRADEPKFVLIDGDLMRFDPEAGTWDFAEVEDVPT